MLLSPDSFSLSEWISAVASMAIGKGDHMISHDVM